MGNSENMHRILLLNFTEAEAEILKRAKFNVEIGYLGTARRVQGEEMPHLPYQFPRPLYEYDISVYNSVFNPDEMSRRFPQAKRAPLADPMLIAFLEWRTRPSLRIAFTGENQGVKTLVLAGLPFLKLSSAHEGVSVLEEYTWSHTISIPEITKLIGSFRKDVKPPVGQYFDWSKEDTYPYYHHPGHS